MTWQAYLSSRYAAATVKRYVWEVERLEKCLPNARAASRSDILAYLDRYRQSGCSAEYLRAILAILKGWYQYLVETKQLEHHPCAYLKLRDPAAALQLQDLFSAEELESLLAQVSSNRNQAIMGLLIYQGLLVGEICRLQSKDIDLAKARIWISASRRSNSRSLALKPIQILPLHQYLQIERPTLLKDQLYESFLLTSRGTIEKGEGIQYLVSKQAKRFPQRKLNPRTIRMSVIANWLKEGINLRKAQYMAGHKKPSSTERYKQSEVEQLQQSVEKYHPLK